MNYAPILLFAFNRPDLLKRCVESLQANKEACQTDLYVFVDGARQNIKGENDIVSLIQNYVIGIEGFRSLKYVFAEEHKGLASSIIDGISEVINQYGNVIVVEDDLVVSHNFLAFMNDGLEKYKNETIVFSICGYSNKVICPKGYLNDAYFCTRSSSWGWATWKDRWNTIDWELKDWHKHKKNACQFNKWGGSDCWKMLKDWHKGKNSSWAIRFCYAQFLQNGISLFPLVSKVGNNGFDGRGTYSKKWTRFKFDFDVSDKNEFHFPQEYEINQMLYRQALSYHSIPIRIWSQIMYLIH